MFEAKIHRYSTPFSGDSAAAMNIGRIALLSQGFEIVSDTGSELHARGPGMHSNQQPPLMGATDFIIEVGASTVSTTATLGGVARMKTFVYLFPPGLVFVLALFGAIAGGMSLEKCGYFLLFVVPGLFFAPMIAYGMEKQTINAVDSLIRGMAQAGARR